MCLYVCQSVCVSPSLCFTAELTFPSLLCPRLELTLPSATDQTDTHTDTNTQTHTNKYTEQKHMHVDTFRHARLTDENLQNVTCQDNPLKF